MKIKIEIEDSLAEDEVIIRCRGLTEEVSAVQKAVSEAAGAVQKFPFYKGNTEYYLSLDEILFFETDEAGISAHTKTDAYQTKYKLYELEDMLPGFFYESIEINDFEYQPYLLHQPESDGIQCGRIFRHTQASLCFAVLL